MFGIGKNYLNCHTKKILYYAQIYSHISYGLILWGNIINNTQIGTLQKLQDKVIRLLEPTNKQLRQIYTTLKILKVKDILLMDNCKMIHRLEHNKLPKKLASLFNMSTSGKTLQKQHKYGTKNIPNLPKTMTKQYIGIASCVPP